MKRARTFRRGEPIRDMTLLTRLLLADQWIMLAGRPSHPAVVRNMSFETLRRLCGVGTVLHEAIVTESFRLPPPIEPDE